MPLFLSDNKNFRLDKAGEREHPGELLSLIAAIWLIYGVWYKLLIFYIESIRRDMTCGEIGKSSLVQEH